MNVIAIIAEYNPFHHGHAYQIQAARQEAGSNSAVLAILSGPFTQRGEPALLDKWTRSRMALAGGVDLVLELPFAYACASAERFASGAVSLLEASGLRSTLVFGSESGRLQDLDQLAAWLKPESPAYREQLKAGLALGLSFPQARMQALKALTAGDPRVELLLAPNNILAVEYLKAIRGLASGRIQAKTITRLGQGYHDSHLPDTAAYASAQAIRQVVQDTRSGQGGLTVSSLVDALINRMPLEALADLMACYQAGPGPVFPDDLSLPLLAALRARSVPDLATVPGMHEGLAQRLHRAAKWAPGKASSPWAFLVQQAKTRRFTQTRIQRALVSLLAGLTREDLQLFDQAGGPGYLRVLGFNKRGRYLLKVMRRTASLPVVTRASDFSRLRAQTAISRLSELDILANDLWHQAAGLGCGSDFDRPVILI